MNKISPKYILIIILSIFITTISQAQQSQIDEYEQLVEKYKQEGNNNQVANYLNKIAFLYWDQNKTEQAVKYFKESAEYTQKVGNQNGLKAIYANISMIYSDANQLSQAIEYAEKSLSISKRMGKKSSVVQGIIQIATLLEAKGQYQKAITRLYEAKDIASELDDLSHMRSIYGLLSTCYKSLGQTEKSQEAFTKYSAYNKYLQDEEFREKEAQSKAKIKEIEALAEAEVSEKEKQLRHAEDSLEQVEELTREKQMEIDLLNKQKKIKEIALKEKEARLKNEALIRNIIIGGLAVAILMFIIILRGYRQKREANRQLAIQNVEIEQRNREISVQRDRVQAKSAEVSEALQKIEKQNKDIKNSIAYAHRIQNAMLFGQENLRKHLPESFIFLRPRDIVSGDFYWFHEGHSMSKVTKFLLNNNLNNNDVDQHDEESKKFTLAAVDCTGHGVPGAFMSMIGFNLLNEIASKGSKSANKILNMLHTAVRNALRQESTDNRDGMDMALCVIDKGAKKIDFAGAKNPLVYIQDGKLNIIKGDRMPIGGIQRESKRRFKHHTIEITKPTTCYIFSDGFQDQFGGPKGRKFMKKNFHHLLLSIHQKSMDEQKKILEEKYDEWKGKNRQVDDVLVIGFRV